MISFFFARVLSALLTALLLYLLLYCKKRYGKYARQVGASQVTLVSVSCLFTYCFTALLHALLLEKSRWCACLVECALLPPQLLRFFVRCFFYSCAAATLLRYVCVPYKQQSASNMSAMLKSNFEIYH
jgi:hypothetical protein